VVEVVLIKIERGGAHDDRSTWRGRHCDEARRKVMGAMGTHAERVDTVLSQERANDSEQADAHT